MSGLAALVLPKDGNPGNGGVTTADGMLRAALAYAAAGWPVFPTRPDDPSCPAGKGCGCKAPFPGTRGCLDASADPDAIRAWWLRWPTANVAIATGDPGPDVLDVDVKADGDGFGALARSSAPEC